MCDDDKSIKSHLESYCPKLLVDHIHENGGSPGVGYIWGSGTCVVLDICGFTALTKDLSGQGREGLVKLHFVISQFLCRCVDIIHEFGGDGKDIITLFCLVMKCSDLFCWGRFDQCICKLQFRKWLGK